MHFDVLFSGQKQVMAHWRCNGRIPNIDGRWAPPFGLVFRCFPPSLVVEWNATLASPHIQRLEVFWANAKNCTEYSIYQSYISIYAYILYLISIQVPAPVIFGWMVQWGDRFTKVEVCSNWWGNKSPWTICHRVLCCFSVLPPQPFLLKRLYHFDYLLLAYLPCLRGTAFCRFSTTGELGT